MTELKKGDGRRNINASSFKKIVKNGIKHCAWCGEYPVTGKRKYCNDYCRDNCYAFIHPQKELGLEYHLQTQDLKCVGCDFDYRPMIDDMSAKYKKRNITGYSEDGYANERLFKRLKTMTHNLHGRGKKPEVDHIIPIALGGDVVGFDNHQVLCYDCHKEKTKVDMGDIAKDKRISKEKDFWDNALDNIKKVEE